MKGGNVNKPQSTLNHQVSQQSSRKTGEKDREACRKNEPTVRARSRVVREFIENEEVGSYSFESMRGLRSEELGGGYCLEKRPRREEAEDMSVNHFNIFNNLIFQSVNMSVNIDEGR